MTIFIFLLWRPIKFLANNKQDKNSPTPQLVENKWQFPQ